ncbi:GNAT family N-acetyltransferase [Paenibacillus protaetiae]|uniref:GNAT family N-acetyltransferase n=1 Tax=Paenibacillus protaetiae TaxID=2509456 RepID=UPI001FCA19FF|nr:GNAT family N-acetyltransferase [Paenibacillus protaetiae]
MIKLETSRLLLRLLQPGDGEQMEVLINDHDIASTTLTIPHPYPKGAADSFIQYRMEVARKGGGYSFGILDKSSGSFMGLVGLHIDKTHNRAELAYWLGKPYWNKGYMTEAAERVVRYAFDELKLNRVWAAAMTKNPASTHVMAKIGMRHEGTFRQHIKKWGVYEDVAYYGLLKEDKG